MLRTLLCAAALCAGCSIASAATICDSYVMFPWGCDPARGEGRNGRSNGPSVDNDLPGGPNVPGGSPIPGRPGGVPTPTAGGDPGGDDPDDPGGCIANCGPGQGGPGNPGNDKRVGKAGENPNGRGFGPTGRRGKNN